MNSRSRVQGGAYFRGSKEGDVALGHRWTRKCKTQSYTYPLAIHQFSLTRIVSNIFRGNDLATGSNSLEIAAVVHGAHRAPIKSHCLASGRHESCEVSQRGLSKQ